MTKGWNAVIEESLLNLERSGAVYRQEVMDGWLDRQRRLETTDN